MSWVSGLSTLGLICVDFQGSKGVRGVPRVELEEEREVGSDVILYVYTQTHTHTANDPAIPECVLSTHVFLRSVPLSHAWSSTS